MKTKPRIPEGGAIEDTNQLSMEEYSDVMKKKLGKHYQEFAEIVSRKIVPVENAKVLEIGPGPGWAGICLLKGRSDIKLDAIEASTDMIRVAIKNAEKEGVADRVNYMHGAVENMQNIPDAVYDLVISRESMHHWDDPEKGLKEINRVLRPGGKLYIQDHRRDIGLFARFIVNVMGPVMAGNMVKYWKSSIHASYTPEEVQKMIDKIPGVSWHIKADLLDL
ncbi:MAG TPA: methyltransferase domain-containing protein, partial [Bacteroidales bacterium]|nr:methyltransferase domain-containing protein [Bacteroidales bacterium]